MNNQSADEADQSDEDRLSDINIIDGNTGSDDDKPLGQSWGQGFNSTLKTLSELVQELVPVLVPALVPHITDGIRDALPDTRRPHEKIHKNNSRGLRELQVAQREEREDEDSTERRSILVSK